MKAGQGGPQEFARQITEAFIRYLELGTGRTPGALTPDEAGRGVAALTGSGEIGNRAHRLLDACDRVLYGVDRDGNPGSDDVPPSLRDEARQLFGELG